MPVSAGLLTTDNCNSFAVSEKPHRVHLSHGLRLIYRAGNHETLEHAIEVSKASITTVAMLEMTQAGREMTDEELKENPAVEQEWDIQWEIFRLLADCEERDIELIKGLRADLREAGESNIGINFQQ